MVLLSLRVSQFSSTPCVQAGGLPSLGEAVERWHRRQLVHIAERQILWPGRSCCCRPFQQALPIGNEGVRLGRNSDRRSFSRNLLVCQRQPWGRISNTRLRSRRGMAVEMLKRRLPWTRCSAAQQLRV